MTRTRPAASQLLMAVMAASVLVACTSRWRYGAGRQRQAHACRRLLARKLPRCQASNAMRFKDHPRVAAARGASSGSAMAWTQH